MTSFRLSERQGRNNNIGVLMRASFSLKSFPFRASSFIALLAVTWAALTPSAPLFAQENHPPGTPGEIAVSEITAHSARISWGAAVDPDGNSLVYLVHLRKRIEGVAQPWSAPRETREMSLVWDGLSAATVYEVKVVAFDGKASGPARIRELAFTTLRDVAENHPPTTPKGIEISAIAAHSARVSWGASTDADLDPVTYSVSVRKRAEGTALEWSPSRTTASTTLVWEGLDGESVYDVRVRGGDGKSHSPWLLKEAAFRTLPEINAPTKPGEISVSLVTSTSARIAWAAANGPAGVTLVYEVQVRARAEGVPQTWVPGAETRELSAPVTGLAPLTTYDVQVRAWAQNVAGGWAIKERAFTTPAGAAINHPPSRPGPPEVSDLTPFGARLSWGPSSDPDGDRLTYAVCLRTRIEGVAQAWSRARETERPTITWEGLSPSTTYEVRIQAWDGKVASDWHVKEHAFATPTANRLGNYVRLGDPTQSNNQPTVLVVWPNDSGARILESTDSLGRGWTQHLEVETDGTQSRTQVPMDTAAKFFRIR